MRNGGKRGWEAGRHTPVAWRPSCLTVLIHLKELWPLRSRAGAQLLPLPCQLRPGNVGKTGETHWMERLALGAAGSLLSPTLPAPGRSVESTGHRGCGSFPELSGWGCALLNLGGGGMWGVGLILGWGREGTELGRLTQTVRSDR